MGIFHEGPDCRASAVWAGTPRVGEAFPGAFQVEVFVPQDETYWNGMKMISVNWQRCAQSKTRINGKNETNPFSQRFKPVRFLLSDAGKGLQSLATLNASAELYLAIFDSNNNRYPVYSKQTIDYLYKESKKDVADLVTLWTANNLKFGYWQMLKRIGKAKEISGCEDYQLLLPIPQDELNFNPNLSQNPGY